MLRFCSTQKDIDLKYLAYDSLLEYWNTIDLDGVLIRPILLNACKNNQIKIIKLISNKINILPHVEKIFLSSCQYGHC
ncbi:unnamed protein product, partial [marine sediment metagenome]